MELYADSASGLEIAVNATSAIGAVAAAIIALVIATRDRKERRSEKRDGDRAQTRLVLVRVTAYPSSLPYRVDVHNHGPQPILNVRLGAVQLPGHPARWTLRDGSSPVEDIVLPETVESWRTFTGEFINPDGSPIADPTFDQDNKPATAGNPTRRWSRRPSCSMTSTETPGRPTPKRG